MLGPVPKIPKVVTVRVKCAEGLKIIPKSEHKQKKLTQKWKVHFVGGKKKMSTSSVLDVYGNPQWDYEVTFKLASKSDPISLLVTDSEDHHVGQVVIPLVALRPRPQNPAERPTDPSRLQRADLEPTKKVSSPHGSLYFWIWVEEYRLDEAETKSSKGSVLSLSSLKHSKRASSVADSLNYSGSVISVNSSHADGKEKKHRLFKKRSGKELLNAAASISTRRLSGMSHHEPSLSRSMGSVFDPTNRSSMHVVQDYSNEDHDGSVLGAGSDLTGSEFYATGLLQRTGPLQPGTPERNSVNSTSQGLQRPLPIPSNRSAIRSPEPTRRISPVREDPREQDRTLSMQSSRDQMAKSPVLGPQPELLRLAPNSCPTTGGVEVTVYGTGLTEEMMRYASVLVDGSTVPRQDWFLQDTGRSDRAELRIHMPERPTGRCWIELETMQYGRIRCPQQFEYTAAESSAGLAAGAAALTSSTRNADVPETGSAAALTRTGSQRSSLLVRDRRSTRRGRPPTASETPLNEVKDEPDSSRFTTSEGVQDPAQSAANPSVTCSATSPSQTPFIRRGSNRDSLSVVDRRSTRRLNQLAKPALPSKDPAVSVQSREDTTGSKPMDEFTVHYSPAPSPYDPTGNSSSFSRAGSQRSSLLVADRRSIRRTREQRPQSTTSTENSAEPKSLLPNAESVASSSDSTNGPTSFSRTGSQRSSLRVSDRRSIRRTREQRPQLTEGSGTSENPLPDAERSLTPTDQVISDSDRNTESMNTGYSNGRRLSKMLTPVVEDAESCSTPQHTPLAPPELGDKSSGTHFEYTVDHSTADLFPVNRARRSIDAGDDSMDKRPSKIARGSYEADKGERLAPATFESLLHDAHANKSSVSSAPVVTEQPSFHASFCSEPAQSAVDKTLEPTLSVAGNAPDQVGSPNRTPTREKPEPFSWTPRTEAIAAVDFKPLEQSPFEHNQANSHSEYNHGHHVLRDFSSERMDMPESAKTESVFSLDLRDPSLQPIASKSPSLARGSYSRGSEQLSMSNASDDVEEDEELPFDAITTQDSREFQSYSAFNPRVASPIDEDSPLSAKFESNQAYAPQDSGIDSMKEQSNPFVRTGSQRSSIRVADRRSMRRNRPASLLPDTQKPPDQRPTQLPQSPPSSDESPVAERYEASGGEAGSESNLSGEHSQLDAFQEFSARRRNSYRSEASGQSRSMLDEHSKLENETLRSMLSEANQLIDSMKKQTLDLEKQLSEKSADVDRLSLELCKLRLRLLEGGATQFLEKCY